MQWLSANFVKLGVAVLVVVGFVIRDDLFPGDHNREAGKTGVVLQPQDQASDSTANRAMGPDSAPRASTEAAVTAVASADGENSRQVLHASDDNAEVDQTTSPVVEPVIEPVSIAAVQATVKGVAVEQPVEPNRSVAMDSGTASTTVKQEAASMTRAQDDAGSGTGSDVDSRFGSGFGAGSRPQSAMRSGTGMMGSESGRNAYGGDDKQLKPGVNPVEVLGAARQAFWENRFADSVESYRVLLDIQPANWMAWGELGNVYYRKGEMEASGEAYYRSAVLMWHAHRYDEAWRLARIIGNLSPKRALDLAEVFYGDKAEGRSADRTPVQPAPRSSGQAPVQSSGQAPVMEPALPASVMDMNQSVTDTVAR